MKCWSGRQAFKSAKSGWLPEGKSRRTASRRLVKISGCRAKRTKHQPNMLAVLSRPAAMTAVSSSQPHHHHDTCASLKAAATKEAHNLQSVCETRSSRFFVCSVSDSNNPPSAISSAVFPSASISAVKHRVFLQARSLV